MPVTFQRQIFGVVALCIPEVFRDARGFFLESYHAPITRRAAYARCFVQDNRSSSVRNVLRGLHFQLHKPGGETGVVYPRRDSGCRG